MNAMRASSMLLAPLAALAAGCEPAAVEHPTWADVEPIVRGSCTHCHGATADVNGRSSDRVYRFDFFDVGPDTCGEASAALDAPAMAVGLAPLIGAAVTPPSPDVRARMPPAPAPELSDRERDLLVRWAEAPLRGDPPRDDRRPRVTLDGGAEFAVDDRLDFAVLIDDPDGESVIGLLQLGDQVVRLDGPGAYRVGIRTAEWPAGSYRASATLCDGWDATRYELPAITVAH